MDLALALPLARLRVEDPLKGDRERRLHALQLPYIIECVMLSYVTLFYFCLCCDPASLSFTFLTRLPGVCPGCAGTPPETLNSLTHNPIN